MRTQYIFTLFLLLLILPFISSGDTIRSNQGCIITTRETMGTFNLMNTTESHFLVRTAFYTRIGEIWNFTLTVHANASSAITLNASNWSFQAYTNSSNWWSGDKEFFVQPGQSRCEQYVSHIIADFDVELNFYIRLNESTKYSSGTYHLILLQEGHYTDIGTSYLYVEDISKWVANLSSTPTTPTTTALPWYFTIPVFLIVYIRRRKLART